MGRRPLHLFLLKIYLLFLFIVSTSQNTRNKRQIQPELPRILTQNGHLVFQTGTNHNITFRATNGGFINVNGENLVVITQTVKDNKLAIDQLRTAPTSSSGIETRISNIENRLNNLRPTGEVQTSLLTLGHRIDLLQASTPSNVGTRLNQLETGLSNLQSTGEVADLISGLTNRVRTLERRVRRAQPSSSTRRSIRRLTRKVGQLEDTVENLQNLLTTNECNSNPCVNGATCVDTYNGFFCRCTEAFQGPTCADDVNECSIYIGTDMGCQNGGTCINTVGSFRCQCTANWHGVRCTENHDDCTGASSTELCGHGTCVNRDRVQQGQAKYTCICDDGWTSSGSDPACVVDVNECTGNRHPCSANPLVPCINLPGSFTCGSCPTGYSGNGFTCIDINECAINNGGCSTVPMVQCVNTVGSRTCGPCPTGYQGNGISCTWVGVCNINNGGCHPQATCMETQGQGFEGRTCTCQPGYVGNGVGATGCVSQGPVTGPCGSTPCMNGGACQNVNDNSYRCICQAGYTGQNCQTNINECASNPCQNGGSCADLVNGYMCQCTDSYTGTNCDDEQTSCGELLTGESGSFRYPAVDGTATGDISCAWRITTTYGKIIMVTFPHFNIAPLPDCNFDFVQVNDGPTAASQAIGRYCGTSAPNNGQPINSTHNMMYFWLRSHGTVSTNGFSVAWTSALPVCGGNLEGVNHGDISSPGYPGNYPHDRDCVWVVTVAPGNNIMFTFATLDLEVHPNCNYDYLEIRDGGLDTSRLLRRYCNTTTPAPLTTTGPSAWVKFHSDSSVNTGSGFHITYAAVAADSGCGGTFTTESGIIISPNYPNAYSHNAQCVWIVTVNDRDRITLKFTNMDLEGNANCRFDYIEVRDGSHEDAPLIGRYCGNELPVPLTTNQNVLFVKFVSDASVTHAGFRATWEVACGGTFTSPTGIIRSPYFPEAYPHNRQCEYLISQENGNRITLTFDSFDVEGGSSTGECGYDYLEIRDGGSSSSPLLGSYCGEQVPEPVSTSSNLMYLKFVTDGSVQNLGFEASYAVTEGGCGSVLTDDTGTIQSPGHPNVYPHGVNCTWNIQVQPGLVVRLSFNSFSMERHSNCNYDYVAMYDDSGPTQSNLIGRYCGRSVPPVSTSTNNVMTVQFISDSSVAHEGFSASYVALNASTLCGNSYTDSTGVITSPNFPNNYPHQRECIWTIVAPQSNQILINVTDFNMESHPNCNYDYLEIRNGGFASSPLVGKYCGSTIDRIIVSHSNRMFIKLVTDASLSAPGFRLSYDSTSTGCGADLTTPTGSFVSPNYPSPYGHNAECFYTITVARGSTIRLAFVDMDIEQSASCYDYIEVRDGGARGALLGKFCGSSIPDPVVSSSNVMWVKFRADYSVSGRGFHAFYMSVCSNTLTGFSGVIESPNFPNPYPHNRNCTWIIDAAQGNSVNISFSHFNIEAHPNCQYDYLQINDGGLETSNSLGTFCGMNLPPPLASTQDKVWIKFMSDFSVATNGFRLEYITNGCGGYLTTPTGSFTSPNYPNPYPHRRTCEWTIVADTNSYIQLTIETFDLEYHRECRFDGLEIYGGPDDTAPQLAHLCHTQANPQVLTSTGNMMFVRFRSDISVRGNGFSITYKTNTGGCGGNYSTPSGSLVSKNYPNNYPHNTDCEWLITVAESRTVELTFTDFDVESSSDCRYDYVAVYDGPNRNSTELMNFCGSTLPSPVKYRSNGNQMYVRLRTDSTVSARGFRADYVTGCGGVINAEQGDGEITSPGYPDTYRRGSNCSWLIMSSHAADRITLTFTHMDLESSSDCNKDYVLVLDGNNEQAPEIIRLCGRVSPSAITSQGSALFVQFVSDMSRQASGFRATYTKASSACGGDYTSQSGSFTSPGYPNNYPINTECVWTVSVAPGNRVQMSFSVFNLESHDNCNYDYVELHEGQLGGPLIGRYCGDTIPSNLTAYNGLWVKFRSDDSNTGQGFVASYNSLHGGDLSGNSGQIASPLYPSQYPHNVHYMWTVTVPSNMRVMVTFTTMDMETSWRGCSFDFLKIRDGGSMESPVAGSYCGTTLPGPYISTTNQIHLEFKSDWSSTGQGFLLNWQATSDHPITTPVPTASTTPVPGCGGILNATDSLQTLTSPGYPDGYRDNLDCTWYLNAPIGFRLWLNITDINIESHSTCRYDILKIFNNRQAIGPSLGTFCGRTGNTAPLVSSRNFFTIRFTTDGSVNRTGFNLQYKKVCGGVISAINGVITSDDYPANYPANSNCTWKVIVPTGRTVRAEFNSNFNIQGTQGSCTRDYLQLKNGLFDTSPPLGNQDGRYCGNTAPVAMETGSNSLFVQFVSDGSVSGQGFSLSFSEVQVTCGGQLSLDAVTTSGVFTSPNYPQNYPHNVDCVWVITAPAHERIQIDFQDDFAVERHSQCRYDFVEMRDGGTINSQSLGKFCGYNKPNTVVSTGNVMYVRFRTDSSVPKKGFRAQYKIATCGGYFTGTSGTLSSPNYPSNYDNDVECIWVIQGPVGHFLTFTFTAFNLQTSSDCSQADFVEIRDINSTGPVLSQKCGSRLPDPVLTSDSYAYVKFVSNAAIAYTGFRVNYEASVEECGGDLTTPTGTFQSPNFPGNYPHSRLCTWRITVPLGRRVTLTFDQFNLESHSYCRYDYIAIYNGVFQDSPRLGRYCGENPPPVIESTGNSLRVEFRTDGSVTNGGFQASYISQNEAVCGGLITSSPGNVTSPGFGSGNYSNNLDCTWILRNQGYVNSSIVIRFNTLKLEPASNCRYDRLEAREGDSVNGVLLDRYCGNDTTLPQPIISSMPSIWLRFRTDTSIVDEGFHLSYNFTQCGGILTGPTGEITSPNSPANYDHNDACAWQINAPEGSQIVIDFTFFDIETHPNCNYDYLEVFNGPYSSSPSIGRFCGSNPPPTIRSQSNSIRLVFFSDFSMSAGGFRLSYSFATRGCGGIFHSPFGNLSTPNFPRSYPHNTECVWDLNVEPGYTITLTFNPPFDMEHHGTCDYDYVEVIDETSNGTAVSLGKWCENTLPPITRSTSNHLVVKFRSDASTNGNGFSANWASGCGGVITGRTGHILSPGFPNEYKNNLRCNYTLLMDPEHYIVLTFDPDNFNLEGGSNCRYDYVAVYAGNSSNARRLGKFCGSSPPQTLSSLGQMFIQFWTDGSRVYNGFRALYSVSECGGVYTSPSGTISTPLNLDEYLNNHNCTWSIIVQPNRIVELKFQMLDLEAHSTCNYDYLDVFDGPSLTSPLIGRYCGDVIPTGVIRTSSNTMTLNFITDYSVTRAGFRAVYRTTYGESHGCGGILNATSGALGSIDGDGDGQYENNLDCRWTIVGANNKLIRLTVTGLDMEENPTCLYDYLKIYDGMTGDDPLVGTYCGSNIPPVITSVSNVMFVRFYSDVSVAGLGFNATYTQIDGVCGGTYVSTSNQQVISSPGYPNAFRQDVRCRWTIGAPTDTDHVELNVTAINLQSTQNCTSEYLELKEYPMGSQGRIIHLCGSVAPTNVFISFGQSAQINYVATNGGSRGFSLKYRTATCNRTYTGYSGQIYSPGWPGRYPHRSNCQFMIQAPEGTTVSLYFNTFHIESHSNCHFDSLEIRNGTALSAPVIGKVCGSTLPNPVFVPTNGVGFTFRTDASITYPGYDISYTATSQGVGCGGNITGINGSFTSPEYPGNYTSASTCNWLIRVPARRVITLTFTDLRNGLDCGADYLIIYDGGSDTVGRFGRYCGGMVPAPFTFRSNVGFVKYVSDGVAPAIAFRAIFTS